METSYNRIQKMSKKSDDDTDSIGSGSQMPLTESGATNSNNASNNGYVILLTVLAGIGGFLFGYDTGVVSGAMIYIRKKYQLNYLWQELIVSVTIAAAAVFALIAGGLNGLLGRKLSILLASFVFIIGSIVLAAAQSKFTLLIGRFIVGAGIGIASMTVPIYIAESAPATMRGRLVAAYNLFITLGQFIAALIDGVFANVHDGWRWMLGLAAVPALVQLIGFAFMPESPRWLVAKGHPAKAKSVLIRIRAGYTHNFIEDELASIIAKHNDEVRATQERGSRPIILQMFENSWTRRALLIGCGVQAFQQFAGINTVMYYSASIIKMAGVREDSMAVWLSAATAAVNFLAGAIGLILVERIGRRHLLIASLCGITACLALLAIGFQLIHANSPSVTFKVEGNVSALCQSAANCDNCIDQKACGFCYLGSNATCISSSAKCQYAPADAAAAASIGNWFLATDFCPTNFGWLVLLGLLAYLACFSPGMGPVPWIINSEIYPLWGRSVGTGLATSVNWACNLLVSLTFLSLTDVLTKHGTYWLYSGVALLGLLFVIRFVPETKGRSLEEIEQMLESGEL